MGNINSILNQEKYRLDGTSLMVEDCKLKKKLLEDYVKSLSDSYPMMNTLDIRSCKIKVLPGNITSLSNLHTLILCENKLSEVPWSLPTMNSSSIPSIANDNLVKLDLSNNQFSKFPSSILVLQNLQSLNLDSNQLSDIQIQIQGGKSTNQTTPYIACKLRELRLSNNSFSTFPDLITELVSLQVLDLSENSLSSIPSSFPNLISLHYLNLKANKFTQFPANICTLTHLVHLNLSYNNIQVNKQHNHMGLSFLPSLEKLELQHNRFGVFPSDICDITSLKVLKIQNNDIESLPDQIGNLVNLVELFLTENLLTTLPAKIGNLVQLRKLYLEFNKVNRLPVEFKKLFKLNILILHNNDLKSFPSEILPLKHLLRLSVDDNPLPELKQIKNVDGGAIGYLKQLQSSLNPESGSLANRKESINKSKKSKKSSNTTISRSLFRGNSNIDNEFLQQNTPTKDKDNNTIIKDDIVVSSSIQDYEDEIQKIITEQNQSIDRPRRASVFVPPTQDFTMPKSPRLATSTPVPSVLSSSPVNNNNNNNITTTDSNKLYASISTSNSISSPSLLTSQQSTFTLPPNLNNSGSSVAASSPSHHRTIQMPVPSIPDSNGVPSFSKFKPAFEQLLEDQDFSKKKRENLQKLSKQEKWNLLLQYKNSTLRMLNYKTLDSLNQSTGSNSSPIISSNNNNNNNNNYNNIPSITTSSTSSTLNLLPSPLTQQKSILPNLVSNLNIKSLQNQISNHNNTGNNSFTTAKFYCEYLDTMNPEINILKDLFELLKEGGSEINSFIDNSGVEKILTILHFNIENYQKQIFEEEKVGFCLLIIKLLVEVATKSVLLTDNSMNIVSMFLTSDSYHIISIILDIYDEIVQIPNIGSNIIIESLSKFQRSKNLSSPYVPLVALLKNPTYEIFTKSIIFKIINTLIYSFYQLEERFSIICMFMKLGILDIIRNLRLFCSNKSNDNLKFELDMFEEVLDNDESELIKKIGRKEVLKRMSNDDQLEKINETSASSSSSEEFVRIVMVSAGYGDFKIKLTEKTAYNDVIAFIQSRFQLKSDISKYGLYLPAIGHDSTNSKWIDESKSLFENSLSGEIVEFRMKHTKIKLINNITNQITDEINTVCEVLIDPQMKCYEIVNYLRTQVDSKSPAYLTFSDTYSSQDDDDGVDNESDVYGIYYFTSVNDYQSGNWYPLNLRLLDFKFDQYIVEIRLKQRCIRVGFKSGTEKLFKFDPYQTVSYLTNLITIEIGLKLNCEDYGLLFESQSTSTNNLSLSRSSVNGKWFLEPEKLLYDYSFIKNHIIYFKFRPRIINVIISGEQGIKVPSNDSKHFKNNIAISQIIESICASNNLDPSLHSLYMSNGDNQKIKLLSRQNTLKDQGINSGDHLLITSKQKDLPSDFNIWDEPSDSEHNIRMTNSSTNKISSISINKLFEKLTSLESSTIDISSLRNTFLTTYRSFISPQILFNKLIERYTIPPNFNKEKGIQIQKKVRQLFKSWVDNETRCDRLEVLQLISNNLPSQTAEDDGSKELFECFNELIHSKSYDQMNNNLNLNNSGGIDNLPKLKLPKSSSSESSSIFDYDEIEIARQITLLLFPMFSKIEISELIGLKGCKNLTPNLNEVITLFNKIANWVTHSIVSQQKIRERSFILTKMIKIANYFFELKNFHCLMAVISGINSSPILRLKFTKSKLSKNTKQNLEELEQIMSTSAGLKNYRPILAESQPPCIPFTGVVLSDLVFIEEGNKQLDETRVNYKKLEYIYNSISIIQKYSIVPYQFKPFTSIQNYFLDYKIIDEKELYDLSLRCEPRTATRANIE